VRSKWRIQARNDLAQELGDVAAYSAANEIFSPKMQQFKIAQKLPNIAMLYFFTGVSHRNYSSADYFILALSGAPLAISSHLTALSTCFLEM